MSDPMLEALGAPAAAPPDADKLKLFGQFVGVWDFDLTDFAADGTRSAGSGEWIWGWILQGRAVEDVWILRTGKRREYGATIRFYDAARDHWRVCWIAPVSGRFRTFVARAVGNEIVLEGVDDAGQPMRWVFSEITPDSYRWRSIVADDGSEGWRLAVEMRVRRRPHS